MRKFNELSTPDFELDNAVTTIYQSKAGVIWIGTTNQGLIRYDGNIQVYDENNLLPNNFVNAIIEDNENNLWISTDNGISKYNQEDETFQNYNKNDGILNEKGDTVKISITAPIWKTAYAFALYIILILLYFFYKHIKYGRIIRQKAEFN